MAAILIAVYWLSVVAGYLSAPTVKDPQGNIIDPYARSKDILLLVFPLVTIVFGYWFGQQGKETAEKKADDAGRKLNSVLDAADPGLLQKAKSNSPGTFTE
ncbi:hypothetical protein [Actinomycetospora sp.]|uniref:hypothetical protein n=1 Tax=Actinomycetospora sp. TaxID=1872135 RepID=UPI002F3FF177